MLRDDLQMRFKDLQPNQRFRFVGDDKIYRKEDEISCSRHLAEFYPLQDSEVELVSDDEKENLEKIEKESVWSYLVHQEGAKRVD